MRCINEGERRICQFVIVKNKLTSVSNGSVLLLTMNFVITLSKYSADHHSYFDNVITRFMISNRTDAWKTDVNLLSICRLYRLQWACLMHFWLKSASTWMVSSDAAAWCVCPCIFRSTNKIYLHSTQYFLYIYHKTMYNKTIIEFGFCDIRNNQGLGKCNQPCLRPRV